ncbi:MAG: arylsulfatase family protein [Rhodoglobus sp.]|nr:arylsulfatase family protein [Rhodoglobus sp.]
MIDELDPSGVDHPNVVVFLTDDHAQWALGAYGNSEVRTPTLDYLAKTGVQFDNGFTPIPVCSPARASFWTGRMPSQHGMHDYLAGDQQEVAAVPWLQGETSLAARFKAAGYTTAMVGKWHIGEQDDTLADFDYWFHQYGPPPTPTKFAGAAPETTPAPRGAFDRHAITDHAINFLRSRPEAKPFFLFVGYFTTHSPWANHPERLVDQYRDGDFTDIPQDSTYRFGRLTAEALYATRDNPREAVAQYYGAISEIDEQVGRVVDEIEAQGLSDSTMIVYTADHGLNLGHHGLWGKGNSTYPYNMLDESIRIPLIVKAPGRILGRQRRAEHVTLCDLHDSLLDFAGIRLGPFEGERLKLPGRSVMPLCRNEPGEPWSDTVFGEYGDLRMIRTPRFKLVRRYGADPGELFDLAGDPRETTNLLGDSRYADVEAELQERLDAYFDRYQEPRASGLGVATLARHNSDEAWREDGKARLTASADWITGA